MAKDLGVINYTEESKGTRAIDNRTLLAGIEGGLNLAAKATKGIILGGVEDKLESEMMKSLNDVPASEAPGNQKLEDLTTDDLAMYEGMSEEEKTNLIGLSNRIRQAKNAYAQAPDAGRRNKAMLAIKRAQDAAKAKFGFMSDEIDRAAATLQNTSPELFAAAMADQDSVAKRASKDDFLNRMRDDARTMDIPESIPIESPEFARMYIEQTELQYLKSASTRRYETLAATGRLDSKMKLEATIEELDEKHGALETELLGPIRRQLSQISVARGAVLDGTGTEAAVAAANERFEAVRGKFQSEAIKWKSKINREFHTTWAGEDPESAEYKTAWALAQQRVADITAIEKLMAEGNINVADYMKAQSHARGARLREKMPTMQQIIDVAQGSNFDVWTLVSKLDHTYSSLALEELVSKGLQEELSDTFSRHVADEAAIGGETTWEDRQAALRDKDSNDPKSGGLTTSPVGSRDHLQEVWGIFEIEAIGGSMATPDNLKVPGIADSILKRTSNTLDRFQRGYGAMYKANPNVNVKDETAKVVDFLGGDKLQEVVENATPVERASFGDALRTSVLAGGDRRATRGIYPQEEIYAELKTIASKNDYGVPFIDLLEVDTTRLEDDGVIIFKLNEDKAKTYVDPTTEEEAVLDDPMTFNTSYRAKQQAEREMKRLANDAATLSKKATQYLRIRAYEGMGIDPTKIDYWAGMRQQRLNTTLLNLFGVDNVSTQ